MTHKREYCENEAENKAGRPFHYKSFAHKYCLPFMYFYAILTPNDAFFKRKTIISGGSYEQY